jgi:glucosylceramidase
VGPTIDVDERTRYQAMVGFGAALTGSASRLINTGVDAGGRDALLRSLFDAETGIGLSVVRVTMGASDFSRRNYTYADVPADATDPTLAGFSIDEERHDVIPVLRAAASVSPGLRVMATPWSAPAWMKTSGSLAGGSLLPDAYPVYARYFRRYVDAMAEAGVPIFAVTVQNEPHHEAAYPSMRMSAAEQAAFIRGHLGPALAGGPQILAWDHNWSEPQFASAVLADPGAGAYVAGSAFHCYAGVPSGQSAVHDAHPSKDVYLTECSGGGWSTDFGNNLRWNVQQLVIGATRHWARGVLLWNLALDPAHGPTNGGCQNCRGVVTVDPTTGAVTHNVEYFALGHASKFVREGARRIASTTLGAGSIETVAFRNTDGTKVLVALNSADRGESAFRVRAGGRTFAYTLPARSVATFRWR